MSYSGGYSTNPTVTNYTPAIAQTQAMTYLNMIYWIDQGRMYAEFFAAYNGTSAGANYTIPFPTGIKIDFTRMVHNSTVFSNQSAMVVGHGQWLDQGLSFKHLHVMVANASAVIVNDNPGILQGTGISTGDSVKLQFSVPVTIT